MICLGSEVDAGEMLKLDLFIVTIMGGVGYGLICLRMVARSTRVLFIGFFTLRDNGVKDGNFYKMLTIVLVTYSKNCPLKCLGWV